MKILCALVISSFLAGALAQADTGSKIVEATFAKTKLHAGDKATYSCTVNDPSGTTDIIVGKVVKSEDYGEVMLNVMTTGMIVDKFEKTDRYTTEERKEGNLRIVDVIIKDVEYQDSGIYRCVIDSDLDRKTATLEVYHRPSSVSIVNATDGDTLYMREGEERKITFQVRGAIPQASVDVKAGGYDITRNFSHVTRWQEVHCPGGTADCIMYMTNEVDVTSNTFELGYQMNGKMIEFETYVPGSGFDSTFLRLELEIIHQPRFECELTQHAMIGQENAYIRCKVLSNPGVTSLEWVLPTDASGSYVVLYAGDQTEDERIRAESEGTSENQVFSLFFDMVEFEDYNKYIIGATNDEGKTRYDISFQEGETLDDGNSSSSLKMGLPTVFAAILFFVFTV